MATKNNFIPITPEWQKCEEITGAPVFETDKSYVIQAIGGYGYTLLCQATDKPEAGYAGGLRIANDASNSATYKHETGYDLYVKTTGTNASINIQEA